MKLSCGLPPSQQIVERARIAEALGYARVWTFDSPALYGDMWIALARVAEATQRIGLGTGVMVPHLRHVLVTASAIATLEELAPGRLQVAVGTGFTARMTMGQRPLPWSFVRDYVVALRALLRGESTEVDGQLCQMIHPEGFAPRRPIEVPLLVGALGPKGTGIAREIGDGIMGAVPQAGFERSVVLQMGTVFEPGESLESPRVFETLGPAIAAMYHGSYEGGGAEAVDGLPGGAGWREEIEAFPQAERHLRVHEGHFVALTERDRRHVAPQLGAAYLVGDESAVRERLAGLEAAGCTELMYCPMGDVRRELEAMARAAEL